MFGHIKSSKFWTRLSSWEYWPFNLVYFPVSLYWLWLSIKARSFFFFSAANPGIEYGGMLGESKYDIHPMLPADITPVTFKSEPNVEKKEILGHMRDQQMMFPVIVKPDIGERGWMVERIRNEGELVSYLSTIRVPFLVQEYIPDPIELGIFYFRYPDKKSGEISSIVGKEMLKVIGDGKSNIRTLMRENSRANLQLNKFEKRSPELLGKVLSKGEELELMPIGNHIRGTTFLNFNHLINQDLISVFDQVSDQIEGFYFGRFDIRCASIEDLYSGKFKILELNGAGAEPGHIYHPGASLLDGYKSILYHLKTLYKISRANKKRGYNYMSFSEGMKFLKHVKNQNKLRKMPIS